MAWFGRESEADVQRVERVTQWVKARELRCLLSAMFGLLAAVDAITGVLGVAFGITAIVLGVVGLRSLRDTPGLAGKRLGILGIALGCVGIVVGVAVWTIR